MEALNDRSKRHLLKFLTASAFVELLPGCGGGGDSGSTAAGGTGDSGSGGDTDTGTVTGPGTGTGTGTGTDTGTETSTALSILAGNVYGPNADGTGQAGTFNFPTGPAVDAAGNIYIADSVDDTVRRISPTGVVSTVAGSYLEEGDADGTGAAAGFYSPRGTAVDAAGTLYVCDTGNNRIRKISVSGQVSSLAGSTTDAPGSADGTGGAAGFFGPTTLVVDAGGNVFVADAGNNSIRRITPAGAVTTFAGSTSQRGSVDGAGSAARFSTPVGIAIGAGGTLYVADQLNHTIRTVSPAGVVATLAGSAGVQGSADGPAGTATFSNPIAITVDASGAVYVADDIGSRLRKISGGVVSTPVQSSSVGVPSGFSISGLAVMPLGNVVATNGSSDQVMSITPAGVVTILAGSTGSHGGRQDGTGTSARFNFPACVATDSAGNVYLTDNGNDTIRMITPAGVTSTLAGAPPNLDVPYVVPEIFAAMGNSGWGGYDSGTGSGNGTGRAAAFSFPTGIASTSSGTLVVADTNNALVRQIAAGGVVTTLAGNASVRGSADGTGSAATFSAPTGVAIAPDGTIYVADYNAHVVRKIAAGGVVTTLAGSAGVAGAADGTGAAARFRYPCGVAVDGSGNVVVADAGNATVRLVSPAGVVTTLAGSAGVAGSADGSGAAARFLCPMGVAVAPSGNVYVSDALNHTIRRITSAGAVSTVAGVAGSGAFVAGALPGGLRNPLGLALAGTTLYVATMCGVAALAGMS